MSFYFFIFIFNIQSQLIQMDTDRFSFHVDSVRKTPLTDNIQMCLQRWGPSIARVFFTNNEDEMIDVPQNFKIYDDTNRAQVKIVIPRQYILVWSDNYTITLNDKVILVCKSVREWRMT